MSSRKHTMTLALGFAVHSRESPFNYKVLCVGTQSTAQPNPSQIKCISSVAQA